MKIPMSSDSESEDRSMRLLQPKIRILYFVYKTGKFRYNISELSRRLGYSKDSWMNNNVHYLLDNKLLETCENKGIKYIRITREGRRKIAFLIQSRVFILVIFSLSLVPAIWSMNWVFFNIPLALLPLLATSLSMLCLAALLLYQNWKLDRYVLQLDRDSL